jgi:hypothetical protein
LSNYILLVPWGGVRLCPLGTSATNWPIVLVPAPDDRRVWSSRWSEYWQGKPKYLEKTCPSDTLSTTNPTSPNLGSSSGRRDGKPATNGLSELWHGQTVALLSRQGFTSLTNWQGVGLYYQPACFAYTYYLHTLVFYSQYFQNVTT